MSKAILAKFKVTSVQQESDHEQVRLEPVTEGSEENKSFSKWTPSGELQMAITNPNVFGFFVAGGEYYLNITPADQPADYPAE